MRTIKIGIDTVVIPAGSTLSHTGTYWQVSTVPDMTDLNSIILDTGIDTVNLLEYRLTYDIQPSTSLYVRIKYVFNTGDESNWSKVMSLRSDQVGIKFSNTIVSTPILKTEISYKNTNSGELLITSSPFKLYGGTGNHLSTTWRVLDSDGSVKFLLEKEESYLTSIVIPVDFIDSNKSYIVEATHHTTTNADSNYGRTVISPNRNNTPLFKLTSPYNLTPNRTIYFDLTLYTTRFLSIDIEVLDTYDNVIISNYGQTTRTPTIFSGNINLYNNYIIRARINLNDGVTTSWVTIINTMVRPNTLINISSSITYAGFQTYTQALLTNSNTTQVSRETYGGSILSVRAQDTNIYNNILSGDKLVTTNVAFTLPDLMEKPYINFIPLYNGDMLVDYATDNTTTGFRIPKFALYSYIPTSQTYTFASEVTRSNENYTTAISASAVPMTDGRVYYIPATVLDVNGVEQPLTLRYFDLATNSIVNVTTLPVTIKRYGSLVGINDTEMLFIGGAVDPIVGTKDGSYERSNNVIYKYNITTGAWTTMMTLPVGVPVDAYNLQAFLRRDGKVVIFNASMKGTGVGNQDTYIYDTVLDTLTFETNDFADGLSYPSTIALANGDFMRISGRAKDPQKIYTYVSDTIDIANIVDNITVDKLTDLIIDPGETITVESLWRFNLVRILGTNLTDSGTLRWIDGNVVREFKYNDLVLTRDTDLSSDPYYTSINWNSITALDGVVITVT